ncbi:MAG: hypothetical protein HY560_08100 [Gemmatimonadetes bacterium]|nr:hypothetical protein [Gemmatimonadota bacterium]
MTRRWPLWTGVALWSACFYPFKIVDPPAPRPGPDTTVLAVVLTPLPDTLPPIPAEPASSPSGGRAAVDTVAVVDPELQRRVERLQMNLLEREAQIDELQRKLVETRQEVVQVMARLQTVATRAEAASGLAEAKLALQWLKAAPGPQAASDVAQARQLLELGTTEFNLENYGGALYLANQAKRVAGAARVRVATGEWGSLRVNEVLFVVPLPLQTVARASVRDGPGSEFKTAFTLEAGILVQGYSYADQWVHVRDQVGRSGWIAYSLLGRREDVRS